MSTLIKLKQLEQGTSGYILQANGSGIANYVALSSIGISGFNNDAGYITSSALSPYLTSASAALTYYPLTNPSGYITSSALSPYLTSAAAALAYQPLATNLTSLSGLSYASTSFVKMTAAGTFALDTNTYLTGNQSITLSSDVSGSGATSISATVNGIKGASVPALSAGFLKYTGSAWTFDSSTYLTSSAIGVSVQGYSASTTLLGNTTTGSGSSIVLGTSPTFTTNLTTPSIILSGNISASSWTTSGINIKETARTFTNTTSIGTVANTYTNVWGGNSIQSSSATTYTNYYANYFKAEVQSTGSTITNNYAAGFSGDVQITGKLGIGLTPVGSAGDIDIFGAYRINSGIQMQILSNVLRIGDGNGQTALQLRVGGVLTTTINAAATSGISNAFVYSATSSTGQTASAEVSGYLYNSYSRTWSAGAITTQREQYIKTVTYNFASASTITNAYGLYVEAATAGSNATITNNYAAGFGGNINVTSDYYRNGTKVVGARDTGWTAFTNTTNKATSYDTATVTLQQLAERVAAMQAALTTHGLLGA